LVPDTEETRLLAGQRLTVVELSDGTVQARHAGKLLPLTRFSKDDAEITQGAMILTWARERSVVRRQCKLDIVTFLYSFRRDVNDEQAEHQS
jgi:hypothetical protein